ncbi:MAG: glycosyltransferase [Pyrinomonadaceae bacterium]
MQLEEKMKYTVLIATYNRADELRETLRSLGTATYKRWLGGDGRRQ